MKVVASTRSKQGTSASRSLRRTGHVPGIIYGGKGQAVNIAVEHNPLFHALRKEKFHASILDMELDGKTERVLLRDFQMHPWRAAVLHIDFQRVSEDQPIHMRVPLHFVGQESSPAVKSAGAIVGHVLSEVDITCLPKDLPEFIEVDLSNLTSTDTIKVLDLRMPAGVKPVVKGKENPVVVTATIPGVQAEEEEAADAAAAVAAAAVGAAGAAVAPTAEVPATAQKAPPATAPAPTTAEPAKAVKARRQEKGGDRR